MRIIVTHHSPDLDAITSIWLVKRFLAGWEEARVQFVPAGERLSVLSSRLSDSSQPAISQPVTDKQKTDEPKSENRKLKTDNRNPIEEIGGNEVIHVDTGLGPLDHHQTKSDLVSAASLTWKFVKAKSDNLKAKNSTKAKAIGRIVKVVVDIDHFKESLWPEASADYHDFSLHGVMDGLGRMLKDNQEAQVDFMMKNLDSLLAYFENKVWAEEEIKKGIGFRVKGQRGIGFETLNDTVLPLAQKRGFAIVIRKDPRKGYVRIKVRPDKKIDLTPVYNKLQKMDKDASWFLHVSCKMLLNGTAKNPKMRPTRLTLQEIIEVLKNV